MHGDSTEFPFLQALFLQLRTQEKSSLVVEEVRSVLRSSGSLAE